MSVHEFHSSTTTTEFPVSSSRWVVPMRDSNFPVSRGKSFGQSNNRSLGVASLPVKGSGHIITNLRRWAKISCRRVSLSFLQFPWKYLAQNVFITPKKKIKTRMIYSVNAWAVLYWKAKAPNYAMNKQKFATKLISCKVPVKEIAISPGCVSHYWMKS